MELPRSTNPILFTEGWGDNIFAHWSLKLFSGNPNVNKNHILQVIATLSKLSPVMAINIRGIFKYRYANEILRHATKIFVR